VEKVRDAYEEFLDRRREVLTWIDEHRDAVKNIEVKRLLDEANERLKIDLD
jgi:hypothetical protein